MQCPPLASVAEPGPLLGLLEWWPLVQELAERATVAEMIGEVDGRVGALRRVLLVGKGEAPPQSASMRPYLRPQQYQGQKSAHKAGRGGATEVSAHPLFGTSL